MPNARNPPSGPSDRVVGPGFHARVFEIVRQIPRGHVATYGQIAALLGSPRVARQVGWALAAAGDAEPPVPWHRVVNARGEVSPRGSGVADHEQRLRLEDEGVSFGPRGSIDLARYRWDGHASPRRAKLR